MISHSPPPVTRLASDQPATSLTTSSPSSVPRYHQNDGFYCIITFNYLIGSFEYSGLISQLHIRIYIHIYIYHPPLSTHRIRSKLSQFAFATLQAPTLPHFALHQIPPIPRICVCSDGRHISNLSALYICVIYSLSVNCVVSFSSPPRTATRHFVFETGLLRAG